MPWSSGCSYMLHMTTEYRPGLLQRQVTSDLACPAGRPGRMATVPKPYPDEFRDDVVRVARGREPGVTIEQVAKDFGVHPMTLQKWLRRHVPQEH